ncbi:tripeptidyl-peptidase 1 [Plasmopara halstedii]|uniref:subtilisin n=1 Tax=Plasmopara halstedii TaxID=4781 RepID=A0A0P1B7P4_PLAHL|nr:tripeptidyl-peptidase 1 [Plasmopara halstedii]CEG50225.1 tripeptidyl-peptidase 1 [Plasmopara halstedii]|eukprot:XP_024586594.1 tripeptidyl-peptidase 1 [Plasmopara halstedii]
MFLPLLLTLSTLLHFFHDIAAENLNNIRQINNAHSMHWVRGSRAAPELELTLRVALYPQKSDGQLNDLVLAVTDPVSPLYGQYLTSPEQLQKHFEPSNTSLQSFLHVLRDVKEVEAVSMDIVQDFWHLKLSTATAERLFSTEMFHYTHRQSSNMSIIRPHGNFSVPNELEAIVAYVDGLESFPTEMQAKFMQKRVNNANDPFLIKHEPFVTEFQQFATPAIIRQQYDIPETNFDNVSNNSASGKSQNYRTKLVVGTFLHEYYNEHDLLEFLETIDGQHEPIKLPRTNGQCTSMYPTGEASLDIQIAASLTSHKDGDASKIEMVCYTQLRDSKRKFAADNQEPFLTFLRHVNAMNPPPTVVSISYSDDECSIPIAYATIVNRELMKAALRGISVLVSTGDNGVRGSQLAQKFCNITSCNHFMTMFPASSPYVTAVGATTLAIESKSSNKWKETVTSTSDPSALITSGGGFSDLFDMPVYQHKAVTSYLTLANSTGLSPFFRITGRALPDVAAVGHAFPVVINGKVNAMDGTSVSAPVFASMILLLNQALPQLPPLGFLNPLFYRLYDVCPQVFADITQGNIACGSKGMTCCKRGHSATTGWDAASGLGTLQFSRMLTDLPNCLTRIKSASDLKMTEQLADMLRDAESDHIYEKKWTPGEQRATQIIGIISLIGAICLTALFVSLRKQLYLGSNDLHTPVSKRYGSCTQNDSAREYLLSS